jgi:hypothetical protein
MVIFNSYVKLPEGIENGRFIVDLSIKNSDFP